MNSKQFPTHSILLVGIFISIVIAAALAATTTTTTIVESSHESISLPGCLDHCGKVRVPYPFGITKNCSLLGNAKFYLNCTQSSLYLNSSNLQVTNISLDGEVSVMNFIGRDCYNKTGGRVEYIESQLRLSNYNVSSARNTFIAVGCDTYATVEGYRGEGNYVIGCVSSCNDIDYESFTSNHQSCSGVGCCQIPIPSGLKNMSIKLSSYNRHTFVYGFNPCSYAFVVEQGKFKFSNTSFQQLYHTEKLPAVLNWGIGKEGCDEAKKRANYACKGKNVMCVDASNAAGYLCQCLPGYEGNPHLPDGCHDIDECKDSNRCAKNSQCQNSPGNWTCVCPKGYHYGNETGCTNSNQSQRLVLLLCIAMGVSIALLIVISLTCWGMKKRKMIELKKRFFEQNGGLMLQQHLSSRRQYLETTKIFSAEELKRATDNYHESRVLGQGGYGVVYKGVLPSNNMVVAIKKSKFAAETCNEQFINEVIMLLQINHRNVVKLLGCCLEAEVPLLVYEYIENGTLFQHIHNKGQGRSSFSWEVRLRIATETASALAYLHSAASTPIIHRDVKTGNILLDDKYTAKVSDFGASRLIPLDQNLLTTVVQGTLGYLDPEYMHTSQLTEKSDVYSFGVVLAELLTGRKVMSFDRPENERNLALFFVSSMKEDRLFQILDDDLIIEGNTEALKNLANLAKRCLRIKSEERPSMKEIAMELEGQRAMEMHRWGNGDVGSEETECLLTEDPPSDLYSIDISGPMCSQQMTS